MLHYASFLRGDLKKGFTLIELLVTISIIAVLTGVLTVNFIAARERGSDGQRKANLHNLRSALELYYSDAGFYPTSLGNCGDALLRSGVTYMQEITCDPGGEPYTYVPTDGTGECNNVDAFCTRYSIYACLENIQDSQREDPIAVGDEDICQEGEALFKLVNP